MISAVNCEPFDVEPETIESLWAKAKIFYELSCKSDDKKSKMSLLTKGQEYALMALEKDCNDFECLRWAAVTTGLLTDFLGTKEKIEQGAKFKEYLDKALAINSREYTLLHMRGRYSFSVAGLSWLERKAASVLYATPPTSTYEEALEDFIAAHEERPIWIENLVYMSRCCMELKRKGDAKKYALEAMQIEPSDISEEALLKEAKRIVDKC